MAQFNTFSREDAFIYIAYASDASGTGFTTTFNASLDYIAILVTDHEIASPVVGDFAGLWKNYKGATGATGAAGAAGATGPQGPAGADGANGPVTFEFGINGQGSELEAGAVTEWIYLPYNATITGWVILGDVSGSITFDVWVDALANFPPTVADSIVGDVPPSVTTALKNSGTNLTNWDPDLTTGDVMMVNIDSVSGFTKAKLIIYGVRA